MQQRNKNTFSRDVKGNVAPFFGLMVIPMLAITGGAIDMSQAVSAKSKLQNALDAATVAVCGGGTGQQSTEEIIRSYLSTELGNSGLTLRPAAQAGQPPVTASNNEIELQNATLEPDGSVTPKLTVTVPTKISVSDRLQHSRYRSRIERRMRRQAARTLAGSRRHRIDERLGWR